MDRLLLASRASVLVLLPLALSLLWWPAGQTAWLALLAGLVLVAWPLALAEKALAVRAEAPLITGMQALTRQSDAPRAWRVMAWSSLSASVLLLVLLALVGGRQLAALLWQAGWLTDLGEAGLWSAATVLLLFAGALRRFSRVPLLLWALLLLPMAAASLWPWLAQPAAADAGLSAAVGLPAQATLLAGGLLLGAGAMVRWPLARPPLALGAGPKLVMMVVGLFLLLALHAGRQWEVMHWLAVLLVLLALAPVLEVGVGELTPRLQSPWLALCLLLVPAVLLSQWVTLLGTPTDVVLLAQLLLTWMAVNTLLLSLYAGWVMKVGHARRALALPSEAVYNLWRVAVRWLAPITLLLGLYRLWSGAA